jgi:hypothetical protein
MTNQNEEREYPSRTYSKAEFGICENAHHKIVILGSVMISEHNGTISLDEFYCPTCNKFWRES